MAASKPNILCFVTDQHRADHIGCYGNRQIRTPHIDRLAAQGVAFTESYVANPVCMPNRASMFTGRYPKAHGLRENGNTLSPGEIVLPDLLREAGYQTASIGKIHLAPFDMKRELASSDYDLHESHEYWQDHSELPLPYYGLENVCLVGGHGPYVFGHYKKWLDKQYPGVHEKLQMRSALEPPSGARQCWKSAMPHELHFNTFVADRTIDFLGTRDQNRPFFVWCSFPDPHHPFCPPQPYCDMYDPKDIEFSPARREGELDDLPDYFRQSYEGKLTTGGLRGDMRTVTDDHYREILALTYGMISMVDASIGRVMDALEELSLLDSTIIVFFSDHGDLMGDHWLINKGPYLYRGLVRVPTIWRLPGSAQRGGVRDDLVSTVDLCPTLLELAGVKMPEGVQGRSYNDVLSGKPASKRDWVYIEYDETYIHDRLRQIRSKDWSITYHVDSDRGLLFDLRNDPDELENLWDRPEYEKTKRDLLLEVLNLSSQADDWLPVKKVHA